jgi:hypothetical protein
VGKGRANVARGVVELCKKEGRKEGKECEVGRDAVLIPAAFAFASEGSLGTNLML